MKKSLFFAAAVAALLPLAACQKNGLDLPVENGGYANLSISLDSMDADISTKATDASRENTIKSVQVFVFRKGGAQDGMLDSSVYIPFASAKSGNCTLDPIRCTVGDREAWAIVNAPQDYTASVGTISDLKKKTVTLADNADASGQSLVMVGNVMTDANGQTVTKLTSGEMSVKMDVSRLVAGVRLAKVINKIQVPSLQNSVSLTGAYLMNVPGLQSLDGSLLASDSSMIPDASWYARNKKASGNDPLILLTQKAASAVTVPYGDSGVAPEYFLYSFASNIGGAIGSADRVESDGTKIRTSTYLVVEAKVGSGASAVDCVYPILLPQLEANKKYSVTLTINHIGGDPEKPWEKIKFSDIKTTINVADWTDVSYSEAI